MDAADDVTDLVGETPLLALDGLAPNLYGKVEAANPYSVKDRIAREMIERAEAAGDLDPDTPVVEATSGNTGIGLASVCAAKGYDLTLTMPDSMSEERRDLLSALGADLVLTPADEGMGGAIEAAEDIAAESGGMRPRQFENEANPAAHRRTTGPEIWDATDGAVDTVVAGVGTGGTITGVGEHLNEEREAGVRLVAVEPEGSPLLSADDPGDHGIQGIGPSFVPETLRRDLVTDVRTVTTADAKATARELAAETGLLVGISSGAALDAAVAEATENPDDVVVAVLPDTGERYLSTDLFAGGDGAVRRLDAPAGD